MLPSIGFQLDPRGATQASWSLGSPASVHAGCKHPCLVSCCQSGPLAVCRSASPCAVGAGRRIAHKAQGMPAALVCRAHDGAGLRGSLQVLWDAVTQACRIVNFRHQLHDVICRAQHCRTLRVMRAGHSWSGCLPVSWSRRAHGSSCASGDLGSAVGWTCCGGRRCLPALCTAQTSGRRRAGLAGTGWHWQAVVCLQSRRCSHAA